MRPHEGRDRSHQSQKQHQTFAGAGLVAGVDGWWGGKDAES